MTTRRRPERMRPAGAPLAIILTLCLLTVSLAGIQASSTERVLTIEEDDVANEEPWEAFDGNPPKVYDFDGDGNLEIIAMNDNHRAYVFDSHQGTLLASLEAKVPSGWGARTFSGPEAAVLTPGGDPHVVLVSSAAYVTTYRFVASQSSSQSFHFEKVWETRLDDCQSVPAVDAKPVLADLDQDGDLEILIATEKAGVFVLRHDGTGMWHRCIGGGNAAPGIGDLDQDGRVDVVHVSDGGTVTALDGPTGQVMWDFHVDTTFGLGSGSIPVQPAVAQLDGKGGPDIVLGARDSHDPDNWDDNHALILALDSDGEVLWWDQHPEANPLTYTRPIIADADGDGEVEVYWADWNTVGHKPPWDEEDQWAKTGPGNFYRYSRTGELEWRTSLDTWWSNNDIAVADVDGDGHHEVLANGPSDDGSQDGIWYLDAETGAKKEFVSAYPWKVNRAPIIADLWDTGTMQWVLQAAPAASGDVDHAILVYDTHAPYDAPWPHVPYPEEPGPDDGEDGDEDDRDDDQDDPDGGFAASFHDVRGNEWWIQTKVESTGTDLHRVDVRLDGGPWRPLSDHGWGWGESYRSPEGTEIQLRAVSDEGHQETSGCYEWTHAGTITCAGNPSDPSAPEFRVGDGSHEWWIEVYLEDADGVSRVDVRIDGGEWTRLSKQDWGAWAKSLHTPEGSLVRFRASGTDGSTHLSDCYRWTDATKTPCDTSFEVDFRLSPNVHEWWVEVYAEADQEVVSVDVRVDGGTWSPLEKKDWGSWARSMHVEEGSVVEFRARSATGQTETSRGYTWE